MPDISRWVIGTMVAVVGLFALYLASRADDPIMYYTGLGFFVASVLFNFMQIKQVFDHREGH
jgi:hypothetical protein